MIKITTSKSIIRRGSWDIGIVTPSTLGANSSVRAVFTGWFEWRAVTVNKAHVCFALCVRERKESVSLLLTLFEYTVPPYQITGIKYITHFISGTGFSLSGDWIGGGMADKSGWLLKGMVYEI